MPTLRLLASFLLFMNVAHAAEHRLYFGTYTQDSPSQGIYTATLDSESGKLRHLRLAAEADNPNYLALSPDGETLYAAEKGSGGQVAAFHVEPDGYLTRLGVQSAQGQDPCHVSVDSRGCHVFAANYGSGSIAVFPVAAGGALEAASDSVAFTGSGPDPKRQAKPYAHSIYASRDHRFVYACDLGTDNIHIFKLEGDKLTPLPPARVPPGSGARMLAFSGDERHAWVVNEMGLSVTTFLRDPATGALDPQQTLPLLPDGAPVENCKSAAIRPHPSGKWLYASTRGVDSLTAFSVDPDGQLTVVQNISAGVAKPRDFGPDPSGRWLVVAGQADDQVKVMEIDPATGTLASTPETLTVPKAVCVLFVPGVAK